MQTWLKTKLRKLRAKRSSITLKSSELRDINNKLTSVEEALLSKIDAVSTSMHQAILDERLNMQTATEDLLRPIKEEAASFYDSSIEIQQVLLNNEHGNRKDLKLLRSSKDYLEPFVTENPLVSVVLPTYSNFKDLKERTIPSILAQTYGNFELIISGDCAPEETELVINGFNDSRIKYFNSNRRGPYPRGGVGLWHSSGAPPFNAGVEKATGLWIAPFSDDDAMRESHLESLVRSVQAHRCEVSYGKYATHLKESVKIEGEFPPMATRFAWQAAIYHRGLSFFELDLHSTLVGFPADLNLLLKMMKSGVRFEMVDEVLFDYYPSLIWHSEKDDRQIDISEYHLDDRVFRWFR